MSVNSPRTMGLESRLLSTAFYESTLTGFTTSTTYVVPAGCTAMDYCAVGGGGGGSYPPGGAGAVPVVSSVTVVPGETLTITIGTGGTAGGGNGTQTTITGSFGTITAAGALGGIHYGDAPNGTYVPVWGWFGGGGGERYSRGGYGGGGCGYIDGSHLALPGAPNSGAGGGGGGGGPAAAAGGTGFFGALFR